MLSFYLSLLETPQAQAAFSQLYHAHCSKLLRIARLILRDERKAEDAVHDTFVKIIQHFENFLQIPCKKQEAWIVTILKNTCLDQLRREKRHIPQDVDEILFSLPDLRQDVEADVRYRMLRDVMKRLSADDRELLELKLLLEWSDKKIAQALGITANAVGVRVHRAKNRLKELLEQEGWI